MPVKTSWHAKDEVRNIYQLDDPDLAAGLVAQLDHDLQGDSGPPGISQLGRTVIRWDAQIRPWHRARVSNGPAGRYRIRRASAKVREEVSAAGQA